MNNSNAQTKSKLFYFFDADETYYVEVDELPTNSFVLSGAEVYEANLDGSPSDSKTGNFRLGCFISSSDDFSYNLAANILMGEGDYFPLSFDLVEGINSTIESEEDSNGLLEIKHKARFDWLKNHMIEAIKIIDSLKYDTNCQELSIHVDELKLSVRTTNGLKALGIQYLSNLVHWSEKDLLELSDLGRKSLLEIKESLATHNLTLGM